MKAWSVRAARDTSEVGSLGWRRVPTPSTRRLWLPESSTVESPSALQLSHSREQRGTNGARPSRRSVQPQKPAEPMLVARLAERSTALPLATATALPRQNTVVVVAARGGSVTRTTRCAASAGKPGVLTDRPTLRGSCSGLLPQCASQQVRQEDSIN